LAKKYASAIDECLKLERLTPEQAIALKRWAWAKPPPL
jgi:hypothetical protein